MTDLTEDEYEGFLAHVEEVAEAYGKVDVRLGDPDTDVVTIGVLRDRIRELEHELDERMRMAMAENAALRELVAGYSVVAGNLCSDGFDCAPESGCRYYHQSKGRPQCVLGELNGKAKELGIEVE
jgi:hypothetical protein